MQSSVINHRFAFGGLRTLMNLADAWLPYAQDIPHEVRKSLYEKALRLPHVVQVVVGGETDTNDPHTIRRCLPMRLVRIRSVTSYGPLDAHLVATG